MLSSLFSRSIRCARLRHPIKGFAPIPNHSPKVCNSALEAVQCVKSGDRLMLHCCACSPRALIDALAERAPELKNVEFTGSLMTYTAPLMREDPITRNAFKPYLLFIGHDERAAMKKDYTFCQYIPVTLQDAPTLLRSPDFPLDVAFLTLSPPDKHGWCSLGAAVTVSPAGVDHAKIVVAEISEHFPRTHGNSFVHYSHLDYVFHSNRKMPQFPTIKFNDIHRAIGKNIAELVPDGACLQMGIGEIPDAILASLHNHKDLGIHTEMFAEGVIDLINSGAVNNSKKGCHVGKVLANFVMGTDRLYKYIDDNPMFHFETAQYTNDPKLIAQNKNFYAINSALEVDLSGQVCADSIGTHELSGVGGQLDFVRGASMSDGGRAIIALQSTAKNGQISRIVPTLSKGASVTTPRWFGPTIVTEYGVADLWGMNTRQRAQAIINIAHPKFRSKLIESARDFYGGSYTE